MAAHPLPVVSQSGSWGVTHGQIVLETSRAFEAVDVTAQIADLVRGSGLEHGLVNVQTRHTTTAIVVNENEPLLLGDLEERLEALAPERAVYLHDDPHLRTVNVTEEERPNGHAHVRAFVLGASESLNVRDGVLQLGRWQRVFLVELDGAQRRTISVVAMGAHRAAPESRLPRSPSRLARAAS